MRYWLKFNRALAIGDYCDAITQANLYALLTNRFLIASSCSRASNGIAMKLKRATESIALVIELLSRKVLLSSTLLLLFIIISLLLLGCIC